MGIPQRILRHVFMAVAVVGLIIGIKACGTPTANQATSPSPQSSAVTSVVSGEPKININTAILSELDKLEAQLGIPALSNKIQASRPYGSSEELVSKKVITQEEFDQIKNQVTIEEIVLTGEALDVDYMLKLGLMKGHMLVAGELLELKKPDQAEPHLGHPVEEIYIDIEEQLSERQVPEFKGVLTRVQDLVKSKPNDAQIKPAYDKAMAAIDQAIEALPLTTRQSPRFAMQVVNGLLETASAEYTAAIGDNKIKEVIEYQDSRGFVIYAQDTVYKDIAEKVTQADSQANQKLSATFKELKTAWPSAIAPDAPVLSVDQVADKVKLIEQTSAPVLKASASRAEQLLQG